MEGIKYTQSTLAERKWNDVVCRKVYVEVMNDKNVSHVTQMIGDSGTG